MRTAALGFALVLLTGLLVRAEAMPPVSKPGDARRVQAVLRTYAAYPRLSREIERVGPVVVARTSRTQPINVMGRQGQLESSAELLFTGRRAEIRLHTSCPQSSSPLFNSSTTVSVPLGKLLGWWGRFQLRTHFPELTPQVVSQALTRALDATR